MNGLIYIQNATQHKHVKITASDYQIYQLDSKLRKAVKEPSRIEEHVTCFHFDSISIILVMSDAVKYFHRLEEYYL